MKEPTLAIIVPHYNQHNTLYPSLTSLLQSHVEKRIVVVDDGSNPPIKPYETVNNVGHGTHFSFISLSPNQGVQFARNIGYYSMQGYRCKYTLFSDSDVIWVDGALDKLVDELERSCLAYAYCDYGKGGDGTTFVAGDWSERRLRSMNYISTMTVIRSEVLESCLRGGCRPFDESIERFQDWDLWLSLLENGSRGAYVPETLFHTEFRSGCISMRSGDQGAETTVLKKHGLT